MISQIDAGARMVSELRELYEEEKDTRSFFEWAAGRSNDAAETSIGRIIQTTQLSRGKAVELARALDEIGCGEFIVGRKGRKSRFRWDYSLRSIGMAAQGWSSLVERIDPEIVEDSVDQHLPSLPTGALGRPLSIAHAKRLLALSYGVGEDAIDITIRV